MQPQLLKLTLFSRLIINSFNIYILTQIHTSFKITLQFRVFSQNSLTKPSPLLTKLVYVYHSNSFMLLFAKLIRIITLVNNSLIKLLTNFNSIFLTYFKCFLISFKIVLNVKQKNTVLSNLITSLLHYLSRKTQLTLIIAFLWTLKDLILLRLKAIVTVCHSLRFQSFCCQ